MPPRKKVAAPVGEPTTADLGAPSSRLATLISQTVTRQPYPVTETLLVTPPTRGALVRLDALNWSVVNAKAMWQEAVRRNLEPRPEAPGADATDDERAEHDAAIAAWESRTLTAGDAIKALADRITKDTDEWNRIFFGDTLDQVLAYFDGLPPEVWDAFVADIRGEFLDAKGSTPDNGLCPSCGNVVDEEQAGKASASST